MSFKVPFTPHMNKFSDGRVRSNSIPSIIPDASARFLKFSNASSRVTLRDGCRKKKEKQD